MCFVPGQSHKSHPRLQLLTAQSVSVSLHRPNMLRYSSWMTECVGFLETCPDAGPTDKALVAWVQLQQLSEELALSFRMDEPSARVNLAETKAQLSLKAFRRKLEEWKNNISPSVMHGNANFLITNLLNRLRTYRNAGCQLLSVFNLSA